MTRKKIITEDQKKIILKKLNEGETYLSISYQIGLNPGAVQSYITRNIERQTTFKKKPSTQAKGGTNVEGF